MKKTIYIILLTFTMFTLTGCINTEEDKPDDKDPVEDIDDKEPILIESSHKYQYSINSNFDLEIYKYNEDIESIKILLLDEEISNDNYYNKDNSIFLKSEYIKSIYEGEVSSKYLHTLETNLGIHEITLELHEKDLPYVYTELRVETNFKDDITYKFEMFDYEFKEVIEQSITIEDYNFNENIVTINNSYIKSYFDNNESKNQLILSVLLEASNGDKALILVVVTNEIK